MEGEDVDLLVVLFEEGSEGDPVVVRVLAVLRRESHGVDGEGAVVC